MVGEWPSLTTKGAHCHAYSKPRSFAMTGQAFVICGNCECLLLPRLGSVFYVTGINMMERCQWITSTSPLYHACCARRREIFRGIVTLLAFWGHLTTDLGLKYGGRDKTEINCRKLVVCGVFIPPQCLFAKLKLQ